MSEEKPTSKIRILAIRLLAALLRTIIFLQKNSPKLFKILGKPLGIIGRFLLFVVVLPLYKTFIVLQRLVNKFYAPQKSRHRIVHPFSRRYLTHIIIIFVTFITVASNLNAYETKHDEFEQTSIVSNLVSANLGTLEQEGPAVPAKRISRYLGSTAVENQVQSTDNGETESAPTTIVGDSAILNPILSPLEAENRQRDKIITYAVQEGDTVSQIAEKFGVSVNTILWENNLTSYQVIKPGNTLTILPVSGIRHKVASGDSLTKIAQKYEVSDESIIEYNKLASADDINTGETLIIPGGKKIVETPTYSIRRIITTPSPPAVTKPIASNVSGTGKMSWPTTCNRITQYFQYRHTGVDIACKFGTSIYAADSGTVIKAQGGWNGGYGIMVVLSHGKGQTTLYGHMSSLSVEVGDEVNKGDYLGAMGSTGRSTGSHVHFEVLESGVHQNPLYYIK